MTSRALVRVASLLVLAAASLLGPSALAQTAPVDLYVDPVLAATDREAVRDAIEHDLGRPVRLVDAAPSGDGLTVTAGAPGSAVVAFRSGERLTQRAVDLPADPKERAQTIALLSGNVVRDEAAELLGQLHAKDDEPPPDAPKTTAPEARPAPSPPAVKPGRVPAEKRREPPAIRCIEPRDADIVGGDFAPYLGLSSVRGGDGTRVLSLNAIGGVTRGVSGAEVAGVVNLTHDTLCGAQIAGIVNVVGGPVRGFDFGGIGTLVSGRVDGVQLGGIGNVARDRVRGAQIAGIANRAGEDVDGAQIAGIGNLAEGDVRGAQVAGIVNVATGHATAQIGLVNVSATTGVPIGLVSIMYEGQTEVFASGSSWGLVEVGLRHGNGFVHNIYGIGARPFGDPARGVITGGIGIEPLSTSRFTVDVDVLVHGVFPFDLKDSPAVVTEARVPIGLKLGERLKLWAAPGYDVAWARSAADVDLNGFAVTIFDEGPSFVRGFPSITGGLSLEL